MTQANEAQETAKKKRTRSPAYPYVNLETAITRAREFYSKEQRNAANITVATKHWGFVEDSSNGAQTIAALISFGLMQDEGSGEKRTVRLTQDALRILLDIRPDSTERAELIKRCALAPKIHKQIWDLWGTNLPSDAQLRHSLLFEWDTPFNENSVDYFIAEYKATISFAKIGESDKVGEEGGKGGAVDEKYIPKVDDYVQWEHNGVLGFSEAKRIREITPDGLYAYVDGQHGAVPAAEIIKGEAPKGKSLLASFVAGERIGVLPPIKTMQEYVVPLADGARAVFQWPTSLTVEDVEDLKDSLKILERKMTRSPKQKTETNEAAE
jgi:hypothetical protein